MSHPTLRIFSLAAAAGVPVLPYGRTAEPPTGLPADATVQTFSAVPATAPEPLFG